MATFLLEIRTEEIPANALPGARRQLAEGLDKCLGEAGYDGFEVRALSTSCRLVVVVDGLPPQQADRRERVTGPPSRVAFADDGSPTKAAEGFARKVGCEVGELEVETTAKGEYLVATVTHAGRSTSDILGEVVPPVVAAMRFPKMMRWGHGEHTFVRPVHGVVALLDEQVVPLELFGIAAGRSTVGHRVHAPAPFELEQATGYVDAMRARDVLVDPAERRERLERQAANLVVEVGGRVHPDEALVAEHVELVEYPGLLRGSFSTDFLGLPREVVIMTLRHHQKCLILEQDDGSLAPSFLTVVDRRDDPQGLVRQGNEWVIGARLADARFFFEEDRKRSLTKLVPKLQRLEFHRQLGSLADKTGRIANLAATIAEALGLDRDESELQRAAGLVKADLVTNMVGEFPELQGTMGGHYLRLEGENEALWSAARDHYQPQGFEGEVPASDMGRLLAVADRLDTVAGLFAVGEIPSGSKDPFGLRRAAQGVVRIVAEAGWSLDLEVTLEQAVYDVAAGLDCEPDEVASRVRQFVADRVRRYLTQIVGVAGDTADAVMTAGWALLPDLVSRAAALERVRGEARFRALALAFKRVKNITADQPDAAIDSELFEEDDERALYNAGCDFHRDLDRLLPTRKLEEAFDAMGGLAAVLDTFFETVLVMAEDPRIRANRIALLKMLGRDFLRLADLSRLQVEGEKK
jgi:glycyl-tRNA synthetase beta chain